MLTMYKFSETATNDPREVTWEEIKAKYNKGYHFGIDRLLNSGKFYLSGWCYDFRDQLKKYLYKQHGIWIEAYAPNKTALRHTIYGRIDKIIEL